MEQYIEAGTTQQTTPQGKRKQDNTSHHNKTHTEEQSSLLSNTKGDREPIYSGVPQNEVAPVEWSLTPSFERPKSVKRTFPF